MGNQQLQARDTKHSMQAGTAHHSNRSRTQLYEILPLLFMLPQLHRKPVLAPLLCTRQLLTSLTLYILIHARNRKKA